MTRLARIVRLPRALVIGTIAFGAACGCRAQMAPPPDLYGVRPEHIWTPDYVKLLLGDTGAILTAPLRWDGSQWLEAGAAVSAVGVTSAFDDQIRDRVQADRTSGEDRFMKGWQNLGSLGSFGVLAVFDAWGELGDNVRAKNTAMDGLTASIIGAGLINSALKYTVGRYRPSQTSKTYRFAPFSGHDSFSSGHATQAFAVATAIAENYRLWWVDCLCYGSAGLVGYARIEQNAHSASDVLAGSVLGWSVARGIVHRHDGPTNPKRLSWSPYLSGDGGGVVFFKSF